ncbi:DUF559 domain-containing protein [Micromonospora sp. CPCC 205539]|uniref:DUF559 domain-containing protein n=1 Tax=Micromonospora sp. CPCC 205539 TaxID=3122408 RepID=UPI002FF0706C
MPPRPHRPDALTWQVFRGSAAIRDNLLTEHQLRSAAWVRLRHDVYADARLDRDHALACRAVLLRLPPGVEIAGPSAAYLHGVEHAATFTDDVHVLVPPTLRIGAQRGLRVHVGLFTPPPEAPPRPAGQPGCWDTATSTRAPASGPKSPGTAGRDSTTSATTPGGPRPMGAAGRSAVVVAARGMDTVLPGVPASQAGGHLPRTDPGQAAWETAVWLEPVRAVAIVDSLLGQGLVDRGTLAEVSARNADRAGGRRARWVFELADPGAQSPPESHLRVRLVLGGLPRPVVQHAVRLSNGLVLHPDLAWPEYRVAVEYDGQWHADAEHLHRDRRRLNQLVGAGWLVLHVTSKRLHTEFPAVLGEVRTALAARGWRR